MKTLLRIGNLTISCNWKSVTDNWTIPQCDNLCPWVWCHWPGQLKVLGSKYLFKQSIIWRPKKKFVLHLLHNSTPFTSLHHPQSNIISSKLIQLMTWDRKQAGGHRPNWILLQEPNLALPGKRLLLQIHLWNDNGIPQALSLASACRDAGVMEASFLVKAHRCSVDSAEVPNPTSHLVA